MPPKFFITHSHTDNEFVARLARDLRTAGFDGFLDIYSLKPGDLISREISRGLDACDFYLPVLSHAALDSPWCELEIHTAITLSNEPGRKGRPRIIPLLVEECQARLDPFLRARLYLKFHENYDAAFLDLLRALGVKGAVGAIDPSAPIVKPPAPKIELPSRITNKAGQEMILIPAAEFLMGSSDDDADAPSWEKPQHLVYLDSYYISRYPVTNSDYRRFIEETGYHPPSNWKGGLIQKKIGIPNEKQSHPVVFVDWYDAGEYCKWVGGRLPTEAEWEKAASWDERKKVKRIYPWGDEFDVNKCNSVASGIDDTTPVGKYSPHGDSLYGVADMVGNVQEWCLDWSDEKYYNYKDTPYRNPHGPPEGDHMLDGEWIDEAGRILRGGSWLDEVASLRCTARTNADPIFSGIYIGFRVVQSINF